MTYINFIRAGWVSPSEFWRMTPDEIWWLYEAKTKTGNESVEHKQNQELIDFYLAAKAKEKAALGNKETSA